MELVWLFLSGSFLANGVPHFVKGVTGQAHMTPLKRVSSPMVNVVWGVVNFAIGVCLLIWGRVSPLANETNAIVFLVGVLAMGLACANLFSNPNAKFPWHKD
ncbi:MAG TPA: hypothetical protein VIK81_02960 [Patescibacteria group bacterium]